MGKVTKTYCFKEYLYKLKDSPFRAIPIKTAIDFFLGT